MAPTGKRKKALKTLSHGRHPLVQSQRQSKVSSHKGRSLIRQYHTLQKEHSQALSAGDEARATVLKEKLERQGGIKAYQQASTVGQSSERGGDSSRTLMDWLAPVARTAPSHRKLRMLEIGALSVHNACSRSSLFEMTRIDLHAQEAGITQQDFMDRPIPSTDAQRFDCVSLSLVLNYVPDPKARGDMLRRVTSFLVTVPQHQGDSNSPLTAFPSLFLVLPAPCVTNSRYMTEDRLQDILRSLGFRQIFRKLSAKLVYYLWLFDGKARLGANYPKTEVSPGKARNNFSIVLI